MARWALLRLATDRTDDRSNRARFAPIAIDFCIAARCRDVPDTDIGCPAFGTPSRLCATPLDLGGEAIQQVLLFPLSPTLFDAPKGMGTSQSTVARLESGQTLPSTKTLWRYAEATGSKFQVRLSAA
jgi:Helix-turn-helix